MFFTSYQFIFLFLPITFVCFVIAHRLGGWNWAINLLGLASLIFYGFFGIKLLLILMASMLARSAGPVPRRQSKLRSAHSPMRIPV